MVAMGHRFVAAARTVLVRAARLWRALHRVGVGDPDRVLVDMIAMHVMEMAIVKIVDVVAMANRGVAAARPMLMGVVGMVLLGAGGHDRSFGGLSFFVV